MAVLTRQQILARKTGRDVVTFSDGSQVHVRGLTRDEALGTQEFETAGERDNYIIATGMTRPKLSIEDVAAWAASDNAGDLVRVSEGIAAISGMLPGSAKEAVKEFEANPGAEFRALPSAEAGDDGGPATGGDVVR